MNTSAHRCSDDIAVVTDADGVGFHAHRPRNSRKRRRRHDRETQVLLAVFHTVGRRITGVVGAVDIGRPSGSRGGVELEGRDWAGSFECAPSTSGGIRWRAKQIPALHPTELLLPVPTQKYSGIDGGAGLPAAGMLRIMVGFPVARPRGCRPNGAKLWSGSP